MTVLRWARRRLAREDGYTLMELLLVISIFGTVTGALTTLFVSATNAEVDSNRRFQSQQEARMALSAMRNQVHCATLATITNGGATVKLDLPSQCAGQPNTTWCAIGSGTRYALYKQAGSTCSSSGIKLADYLTNNVLFSFNAATTDSLSKLTVIFPVNTKPSQTYKTYTLQDTLTLRNSTRLQ